jgi:hypothetical protein
MPPAAHASYGVSWNLAVARVWLNFPGVSCQPECEGARTAIVASRKSSGSVTRRSQSWLKGSLRSSPAGGAEEQLDA